MIRPARVVLYARVTRLARTSRGSSLISGAWAIVEEYSDVISGAAAKRPGLDRLMEDGRRRRFDIVLTWRLDRLGRSLVHLVRVVDELLGFGVAVVSTTEPHMDSTTPEWRLMRNIFASVAEYERELIRERVRASVRRSRARRRHWARPPEHVVDFRARTDASRPRLVGPCCRSRARPISNPDPPSPQERGTKPRSEPTSQSRDIRVWRPRVLLGMRGQPLLRSVALDAAPIPG
jgi:DNA invertase Pin-like site-specific DNA recombinase